MAHAPLSCRPDIRPASPAIDRRRFLYAGVGCVVPLLAGTTLGRTAAAWPLAAPATPSETDAVLNHINRELLRVCKGMQGVAGVTGEHVRGFAANLDLMMAYLVDKGHDRRLEAHLKDGQSRLGRDGFAHELLTRQAEAIAATAERYGIVNRTRLDLVEMGAALDAASEKGITTIMRESAPGLRALAARIDRSRAVRDPGVVRVRQKPGDDFGGYVPPPMLTCKDLRMLMYVSGIASAVFGMFSFGVTAGLYGLGSLLASMLYDWICTEEEAY
jgi:hypothetical protein